MMSLEETRKLYAEVARDDIQEIMNDRQELNESVRAKMHELIEKHPGTESFCNSILELVDIWDRMLRQESAKNNLVDYENPESVCNRIKELRNVFSLMRLT